MIEWFIELNPAYQGLLATLFTYSVTVLGASLVFFFKNVNQKVMDVMMGFAAGVMIAASYWSLLILQLICRNRWEKMQREMQRQGFFLAVYLLLYPISSC